MIDERFVATSHRFDPPPDAFERLRRRRDRKRRNQRIAAGVVGIAVFVAAVWIVTSVGSLDRSETSVVPGVSGTTGPVETGPVGRPAPPLVHASAAPDVISQEMCSDGARSRLELTDKGDRIKVRFEVYRSPPGHTWRIRIRIGGLIGLPPVWVFVGSRVADESGDLVVQQRGTLDTESFVARATDDQTGQHCRVFARV